MSENTNREEFEAHMIKTFGKGINLKRESEWVDENTTTGLIYLSENVEFAWHGFLTGLAHKKNESVAEAYERCAKLLDKNADDTETYTPHSHIIFRLRSLAKEIRALIKDGE